MSAGKIDLPRPRVDAAVRVRDGRRLGVAEYGVADGHPVLWFHGIPGGRHQVPPIVMTQAGERGLRVISIERPGIGKSTKHLYRRVRGFADDVDDVLESLQVSSYSVIGMSGGGAYAMACADAHADRVVSLSLLCSVAPAAGLHRAPGGGINRLARRTRHPMTYVRVPLGGALWMLLKVLRPVADPIFDAVVERVPEADARALSDPETRAMFVGDLIRNSRRQSQAVMNDAALLGRHWGFDIGEITAPTRVWQGTADWIVPPAHGAHLATWIPNATLDLREGEGHLAGFAFADGVLDFIAERLALQAPDVAVPAAAGES